jgi:hypothetical protein
MDYEQRVRRASGGEVKAFVDGLSARPSRDHPG